MSLIPGSLGASPMQNIGAYGVEVKDRFEWLEAYHIKSGEIQRFNNSACEFGYRESIFKHKNKGQYIITKVAFRLTKKHELNTSYGAIEQELETLNITEPTIKDVSNAVIKIRESKLPDPKKIGNSGSFFKNPIIDSASFEDIKAKFPKIVSYPAGNGKMKIAAGWLIDQAGWKGRTMGNYGVHKNQALVLVNYGGSSGSDIYNLSEEIIRSIKEKYRIDLEREVNIL
jgi:UDP-N-acetylmuramate dehydrogenase